MHISKPEVRASSRTGWPSSTEMNLWSDGSVIAARDMAQPTCGACETVYLMAQIKTMYLSCHFGLPTWFEQVSYTNRARTRACVKSATVTSSVRLLRKGASVGLRFRLPQFVTGHRECDTSTAASACHGKRQRHAVT